MSTFCYILHSSKLDRYYIGSTELPPEQRLELHLNKHYGNTKFTASADDWIVVLEIVCESIEQARKVEAHIKQMKSKKYVENLIKYPEMRMKLLDKYPGSPR